MSNINGAFGEGLTWDRIVGCWFWKLHWGGYEYWKLYEIICCCKNLTWKCPKNVSYVSISTRSRDRKKVVSWRNSRNGLHIPCERQRDRYFEVCLMQFLRDLNSQFPDRILTCDEQLTLYDNRIWLTQWFDSDEESPNLPNPKFHEQNSLMVSHWRCPLQLSGMEQEHPCGTLWPAT